MLFLEKFYRFSAVSGSSSYSSDIGRGQGVISESMDGTTRHTSTQLHTNESIETGVEPVSHGREVRYMSTARHSSSFGCLEYS